MAWVVAKVDALLKLVVFRAYNLSQFVDRFNCQVDLLSRLYILLLVLVVQDYWFDSHLTPTQ